MRAVLTSLGITGDAQPFLTLTVELRRHNHRPVLALAPEWRQRVEALDLERGVQTTRERLEELLG